MPSSESRSLFWRLPPPQAAWEPQGGGLFLSKPPGRPALADTGQTPDLLSAHVHSRLRVGGGRGQAKPSLMGKEGSDSVGESASRSQDAAGTCRAPSRSSPAAQNPLDTHSDGLGASREQRGFPCRSRWGRAHAARLLLSLPRTRACGAASSSLERPVPHTTPPATASRPGTSTKMLGGQCSPGRGRPHRSPQAGANQQARLSLQGLS